ncbi:hypothetical protein Taro_044241 [Colocasia esculenta]|uniref:Uncharacterized protein n=1 Tax=Colocasia esculenta TaxID=4460 RepID=A0A843X305_COLES|nr:hypothetical protein [Colocasia esculenta]
MATLRPAQPFWTGRDKILVVTRPVLQKGNNNRNGKQAEGDGPHVATRMAIEVLSPSGVPEGDASMRRHLGWRQRCCRLQEFLKATHRCVATWVATPKVSHY